MSSRDIKAPARTNQATERIKRSRAAPNVRSHGRAYQTELWEWPETKDEARTENYVKGVRQPQRAHCDCRITGAAENGIDHEKHQHRDVTGQHDGGKTRPLLN